jgi:hypothetical protein
LARGWFNFRATITNLSVAKNWGLTRVVLKGRFVASGAKIQTARFSRKTTLLGELEVAPGEQCRSLRPSCNVSNDMRQQLHFR